MRVRWRESAPADGHLHYWKQPELDTNLAQSPVSVQIWGTKLSKSCPNFWNLLVRAEKKLWKSNVLPPSMPLYWMLYLFRTSFLVAMPFYMSCSGGDVSICKPYVFETRTISLPLLSVTASLCFQFARIVQIRGEGKIECENWQGKCCPTTPSWCMHTRTHTWTYIHQNG